MSTVVRLPTAATSFYRLGRTGWRWAVEQVMPEPTIDRISGRPEPQSRGRHWTGAARETLGMFTTHQASTRAIYEGDLGQRGSHKRSIARVRRELIDCGYLEEADHPRHSQMKMLSVVYDAHADKGALSWKTVSPQTDGSHPSSGSPHVHGCAETVSSQADTEETHLKVKVETRLKTKKESSLEGAGIERNRRNGLMESRLPMHRSRRCGARTRRGTVCQSPAMPNGRCRIHGGKSPGARVGNSNARKHGRYTAEAIDERRKIAALIRTMKSLATDIEQQD